MADQYQADVVQSPEERAAVFAVRMTVFVLEQSVPAEEELDAFDQTATHFLVRRLRFAPRVPEQADLSPLVPDGHYDDAVQKAHPMLTPPADSGDIIGAARLLDKGAGTAKVGRVAVLREHRGRGVGALLMRFIETFAGEKGVSRLVLDAQCHAIPFYEKLGYKAEGDIFLDAGIEHRFMVLHPRADFEGRVNV